MPDGLGLDQHIGRLEGKLESIAASLNRIEDATQRVLSNHDTRLRGLEQDLSRIKGIGTVVAVVWPIVTAGVSRIFFGTAK